MEFIWIFAAIFAAACQTARSAFQKNMISKLGEYGAAYIRFCYALPFTSLIWLIWISIPGNNIPDLSIYSLFLCLKAPAPHAHSFHPVSLNYFHLSLNEI